MGRIKAVCISEQKGTPKTDVGTVRLIEDYGIEGDAHAGTERQVSLLSVEKVDDFRQRSEGKVELPEGIFGENLLVEGIDFTSCRLGTRLRCGDVILEIMQFGKSCHNGCVIRRTTGECIMPKEGVFAKVIKGGIINNGDMIDLMMKPLTAAVITLSDRSFKGEREDKSGPLIREILADKGYRVSKPILLPDDEEELVNTLIRICDEEGTDLILTTGGTGLSARDRTPEATLRVADRNVPGIAEAIRVNSLRITSKAMLSRAVSVIRKNTLIINLPGSPKAVRECLDYILPALDHGLRIMRGEADG